jgi:hypothetical protein
VDGITALHARMALGLGPGHQDDTATPEIANPDVIVTVILCAIISLTFAVNY